MNNLYAMMSGGIPPQYLNPQMSGGLPPQQGMTPSMSGGLPPQPGMNPQMSGGLPPMQAHPWFMPQHRHPYASLMQGMGGDQAPYSQGIGHLFSRFQRY
jgi:hypothetical protein